MIIKEEKNRVYFNYDDKSFANISIKEDTVRLELIKTLPQFRKFHIATKLMLQILQYIKEQKLYKIIYLNPLPLDRLGLDLEQLIVFYSKFGFKSSPLKDQHCPYLMEKHLD